MSSDIDQVLIQRIKITGSKFFLHRSFKILLLIECVHLLTGDTLPPVDPNRVRLYSMLFCPYVHRTKLVLEHKKIP